MSERRVRSDKGTRRTPEVPARTAMLKWFAAQPPEERQSIRKDLDWLEELIGMVPAPEKDETQA